MDEASRQAARGGRQGSRRKSREIALSLLFSADCRGRGAAGGAGGGDREETLALIESDDAQDEYARHLVEGVARDMAEIDGEMRGVSHNWRVERMSFIDRNILRISIFELREGAVPVQVVINEAVELAKLFGDDKSGPFVNGILDAVARKLGAMGDDL